MDWLLLALLLAPCAIVAYFGWTLFPAAFPIASAVLLAIVISISFRLMIKAVMYIRSIGDAVDERFQSPLLWDAVHVAASRVGIPAPRIFVIGSNRKSLAFSWGAAGVTAVAVNERILRTFTPSMLAVAMAHEVAHLRLGDTVYGLCVRGIAAWLRGASILLFLAGVLRFWQTTERAEEFHGLLCCFVAASSVFWIRRIGRQLLPWLSFFEEFAADALAVAVTGDPKSMIEVMLYAIVEQNDARINDRPLPGMDVPPPITRIRRIVIAHPDVLKS